MALEATNDKSCSLCENPMGVVLRSETKSTICQKCVSSSIDEIYRLTGRTYIPAKFKADLWKRMGE